MTSFLINLGCVCLAFGTVVVAIFLIFTGATLLKNGYPIFAGMVWGLVPIGIAGLVTIIEWDAHR